jgi:putative ABC transport system permease protein
MWSTTIKGIAGHKRRFLSTCVAVVLGVTFLTGTLALGDTIRGGFDDLFAEANEGTAVVVRSSTRIGGDDTGQRGVVDPAVVDVVGAVPGVAAIAPEISGPAQIIATDGTAVGGDGPPTLGSSWIDDPDLNPYRVTEGRAPELAPTGAPVEVVIDKGAAQKADLAVGDTTTVLVPDQVAVEVVGLVGFGEADSMAGTTFTGFAPADAERLLGGGESGLSEIRVAAGEGISPDELQQRIVDVLPTGAEALTGAELSAEQLQGIEDDFLRILRTMLVIFAGVALLVATFSIHNTFAIVAAQRGRESALLRALGATRAQVLGSVVLEAVLVGVVATAVGLAAGIGLASGLETLIASADTGLPPTTLSIGTGSLVVPVVVGLGITLVAALGPALHSSRVSPLAALRSTAVEDGRIGRARTVVGLLAAAGGVALIVTGAGGDGDMGRVGLGSLVTAVAFVLLGPLLARPFGRLAGRPARVVKGITGQLAQENAVRNPRRTAGTATALVIGIGVVAVFTVFGASLRTSISDEVTRSFGDTDLVVQASAFAGSGLPPTFVDGIAATDGVRDVSALTFGDVRLDGSTETATVTDPTALEAVSDLEITAGSLDDLTEEQVAISGTRAKDEGWELGTTVPMEFADGTTVPATIGVLYSARGALGDVIVPSALWDAHTLRPTAPQVVLVGVADGVDVAMVDAEISELARTAGAPKVQTRDEYVQSVGAEVDQFLVIIYMLLAVAVVIALLGIANTLTLSIHERTRELGVLRAVGQTRRQLRSMVRWESAIVATFGALAGIGIGSLIGWGLVRAGREALSLNSFSYPTGQMAVIVVVGAVAGVVAAIRPARRAARLNVLDAITSD